MTGQEAYYKFMTYIGTHKDNELKEAFNVFEKTLEENQELKEKLNLGNAVCSGFSHNGKALVLSTLEDYDRIMTRSEKLEKTIKIISKILGLEVKNGCQHDGSFYYYLNFAEETYIDNSLTQQEAELLENMLKRSNKK